MKRLIRSFIIFICTLIFGIGAFIISFILFPIGIFIRKKSYYRRIIQYSWKIFTCIIVSLKAVKITINGDIKNIRGKIIASSHPTLIDIILLIGMLPKSVCIAKKDLLKNPLLRNIVKNAYIINDSENFIENCQSALDEGYNIIIFPTGTRTATNEEIKIHKGAAQLAIKTNTEIIPVKLECDYNFMSKHKSIFDAGEKTINYTITIKDKISIQNLENLSDIKLRNRISKDIKKAIN